MYIIVGNYRGVTDKVEATVSMEKANDLKLEQEKHYKGEGDVTLWTIKIQKQTPKWAKE